MNDIPDEAPTEPTPNLQARGSLRRHARAAAAHFAAQAEVDIEDEALALVAEFIIAVTLTADTPGSLRLLPHATTAAARVLFSHDELERARADVGKEGLNRTPNEDERDARQRADKEVARFFDAVNDLNIQYEDDPVLKVVNNRRLWRGNMDWAGGMALLINVWRKRRRRERSDRDVAEALRALSSQGPPEVE
jgi:hypothetical protein